MDGGPDGPGERAGKMKPSIGKVAIFIILIFVLSFLPLYPVHVDRYVSLDENNIDEWEESGTKLKSLYMVLDGDFNWTELDMTFRQESLMYRFTYYHLSYYDASQYYLVVYGILFLGAYMASCYYIESYKD